MLKHLNPVNIFFYKESRFKISRHLSDYVMHFNFFERSNLLFFCYDLGLKKFTYANPAFQTFFEPQGLNVSLARLLKLVHPEDHEYVKETLNACADGQELIHIDCRILKDGEEVLLRINPYLINEDGEKKLTGYAENITQVEEHKNAAEHENKIQMSLLNNLAHDLSGPIGNISNLSFLINKETAPLKNQRVDEYVKIINKITKNSLRFIRDFVNLQFLESSNAKLPKTRVEVISKIRSVIKEYRESPIELNRQIIFNTAKESLYFNINANNFLTIIDNLISNALKFTHDNGIIVINIEEKENFVLLTVADNGIGIPQKHHSLVFDKFTTARKNGLKGQQSNGLGLSTVKAIVNLYNGKIWFDSKEHEGTSFFVELPK